jgi:hypothetical protein
MKSESIFANNYRSPRLMTPPPPHEWPSVPLHKRFILLVVVDMAATYVNFCNHGVLVKQCER